MPMFNINYKKNKLDNQYLLYLWYCGLGYVNETRINKLHKKWYFDHFDYKSYKTCEVCLLGEMTRTPFTGKNERYKELLGLIHTDIHGPMTIHVICEYTYFITFTNDYSRYNYVHLIKHKYESFERFKKIHK
jgi:hypothetical protein